MEEVLIPDTAAVLRTSKDCIDRPATLAEVLGSKCRSDNTSSTAGLLDDILAKLTRHENDVNVLPKTDNLSTMVKDLILTILSQVNENRPSTPFIIRFFKTAKCLHTVDTIGDNLRKGLEEKTKDLDRQMKRHKNLTVEIQDAQRKCWLSKSKVSKYQLMLSTAESSRIHLAGQLTKREAKSSDRTIVDLKRTLKQKQERADNNAMAFSKLVSEEETMRQRMKKEYTKVHGYAEKIPIGKISKNRVH